MKKVGAFWLPDVEHHMAKFIESTGGYQVEKQKKAMELCRNFRTAVDVGAHVGTWAQNLEKRFETVHCFEPMPLHLECLEKNVEKAVIHKVALSDKPGKLAFTVGEASTGDTRVKRGVEGDIEAVTLDSFDLENVDFIKIDNEGYELFVLQGAVKTLQKWRPLLVVEQKPGKAEAYGLKRTQAVEFLEGMGAKLRAVMAGDYFLSWDE